MACGDRLVVLAPQLIQNLTSNLAECYMGLRTICDGGNNTTASRLDLSSTDASYTAGLRAQNGPEWGVKVLETVTGDPVNEVRKYSYLDDLYIHDIILIYSQVMQAAVNKRSKQLNYDKQRKESTAYLKRRRSARHSTSESTTSQHHYGVTAQQPDVPPTELKILCSEYLRREIAVNRAEAAKIEKDTRNQSDSGIWYHHRRIRLTASNFGMIAKRRPTTPIANAVKTLLYTKGANTKAMRWGRTHEDDARQSYIKYLDGQAIVTLSGLVVDLSDPCLGCSPDGLVHIPGHSKPDWLVEIKCPYTAAEKNLTPEEVVDSMKFTKKHNYYYHQMQGQMAVTRRPWCDFVVWTPKGIAVERIRFNGVFWDEVKPKLVSFHHEAILPELALPRQTQGQPIRERQIFPQGSLVQARLLASLYLQAIVLTHYINQYVVHMIHHHISLVEPNTVNFSTSSATGH